MRAVLGALAGLLPRRLWPRWDGAIPITRMAVPSALSGLFLAAAIGIPAFLHKAQVAAEAAARQMNQMRDGPETVEAMMSLPLFLFFDPLGVFSLYLALSSVYRIVAAAGDNPSGDPILTAADAALGAWAGRRSREQAAAERLRQEGEEVADVLLTGKAGGASAADVVLVCARRKEGWDEGLCVLSGETWYRLGRPFERRYPGGRLRTLYPLSEVRDALVMRRRTEYTLPPLSEAYPGATPARPSA